MAQDFLVVPALEEAASLLSEDEEHPIEGLVLDRYRIEKLLGVGGMGQVYLAEDMNLAHKVAIKFLPSYMATDELAKKRLIREAQAAAQLDHPNICRVYEVKEESQSQFHRDAVRRRKDTGRQSQTKTAGSSGNIGDGYPDCRGTCRGTRSRNSSSRHQTAKRNDQYAWTSKGA